MTLNTTLSELRDYILATTSIIRSLPGSIRDGFDEMRWSRTIAYVDGPTCVQYAVEPHSHKECWPMKRAEPIPTPEVAAVCQATVEAVAEALEPVPENVTRLKKRKP